MSQIGAMGDSPRIGYVAQDQINGIGQKKGQDSVILPDGGKANGSQKGGVDPFQPDLSVPTTNDISKAVHLTLGGLSLETLLDAVGMEQRRTETKAGVTSIEARAQERQMANDEKIKNIQENLEKMKSQSLLDKFLKAFKYIAMIAGVIAGAAMIATGVGGVAGGLMLGSSLWMLADSITMDATDGKVGLSLGFGIGKAVEAGGGSESAVQWTKFGVDLTVSLAMIAGGLISSVSTAANAAKTAVDGLTTLQKASNIIAKAGMVTSALGTVGQGVTSIVSASNERDISFLQAQQKKLQAILERIAMANELSLDHIKAMMERSEQTLQQVSEIVQEGVQANVAIMSGAPAMA